MLLTVGSLYHTFMLPSLVPEITSERGDAAVQRPALDKDAEVPQRPPLGQVRWVWGDVARTLRISSVPLMLGDAAVPQRPSGTPASVLKFKIACNGAENSDFLFFGAYLKKFRDFHTIVL